MATKQADLCADIGYVSINHAGEQLCGDHVEVVSSRDGRRTTVVLADGLGSGVKANILSTIASKILSTMLSSGLRLEDAVETLIETLPVCSVRKVAYSTFTVISVLENRRAEIVQYDSPRVMFFRDGRNVELPFVETVVSGKRVLKAGTELREGDALVAFTDGVEHAGIGIRYDFGWKRSDIVAFLSSLWSVGFTAKTLSAILVEKTNRLYEGKPGDDATVCTVRIRGRVPVNLLVGPPADRDDDRKMMALFFAKKGKHIVCGGTTGAIAADYLGKPLVPDLGYPDPEIPPTATIEGVDLVTEGVVTINRVLAYAKDYLADNRSFDLWCTNRDGASRIARVLFEEATDISFFVGQAVNPAHQNIGLPVDFTIKMQLVRDLAECLGRMGKQVTVSYF